MTLASGDLTTLADVKLYIDAPPSDAVLSATIPRISTWIRTVLNRPFLQPKSYTEQRDGTGTRQLVLPHYPILTVQSVAISGVSIGLSPQASSTSIPTVPYGYRFQPWNGLPPGNPAVLELVGFNFLRGHQNVVVTYTAGYEIVGEAQTVPASPGPYTVAPLAPYGIWATDQGVTYATSGIALVAVPGPTVSTGQYIAPTPNAATPNLNYTFAAGDAGAAVLLNYGYVPGDLEQACIELVAERVAYRKRVGMRSQALASQETFSYDLDGIPKYIADILIPYVSVLPPPIGASV